MPGSTEYKNKWHKEHNDQINLQVPKGKKAIIREYAQKKGKSVNGYIINAIDEKMARDDKEGSQPNG